MFMTVLSQYLIYDDIKGTLHCVCGTWQRPKQSDGTGMKFYSYS